MAKETKTNAMRILDRNRIEYTEHLYDCDDFLDGVSIAQRLNQPPEKTFKTLVTIGKSKAYYVFVIPVAEELDLKAAACSVGEKSVELIPVAEINAVSGYIRGGCSPIGMKKQYKTVIDKSAESQSTIMFSGGRRGAQIEMNPIALSELVGASFAGIVRQQKPAL